jgi:hypothetical protein
LALTQELVRDDDTVRGCATNEFGAAILRFVAAKGTAEQRDVLRVGFSKNAALFRELCCDKLGHYVVQELLRKKSWTVEQREPMIQALLSAEHVQEVIKCRSGSFVLQGLLKHGSAEEKSRLYNVVKERLSEFFTQKNATYCVSQMVSGLVGEDATDFAERLVGTDEAVVRLATDKHANFVLTDFMREGNKNARARVIAGLKSNATALATHEFGHFAVMNTIKRKYAPDNAELVDELIKDEETIVKLAQNQWGKVVMRMLLQEGTTEQCKRVNDALQKLMKE